MNNKPLEVAPMEPVLCATRGTDLVGPSNYPNSFEKETAMPMNNPQKITWWFGVPIRWQRVILNHGLLCFLVLGSTGCASYLARKHLEGVASGWCQTIRASQVIPVYPLTEDLMPGDVFLVQTPIQSQASLYRKQGFLPLDDHRTRLQGLAYTNVYFDGYWKDAFGKIPHELANRTNAGSLPTNGSATLILTETAAPRAAFPTYSFASKSGFGLAMAIPVKGVPVGLNFLRSDNVNGSVTIADARTYAADELELYNALLTWTEQDRVRQILSETVERADTTPVFLRVISRVYLTGAVIVSLHRSDATGAGAKVGMAPELKMVDASGNVNANYLNLLDALNTQANPVSAMKDAGGAIKFVGASESSVALAESFDRALVIGYLGFDVPVYAGGDIGAPIPTFQVVNGAVSAPAQRVGALTPEQKRFQLNQDLLEALAKNHPEQAVNIIARVLNQLYTAEFKPARGALSRVLQHQGDNPQEHLKDLLAAYKTAAVNYVTIGGNQGERYAKYDQAFLTAYQLRNTKP